MKKKYYLIERKPWIISEDPSAVAKEKVRATCPEQRSSSDL
jgi:uncharacterized Fe-S cluster protein YjdI